MRAAVSLILICLLIHSIKIRGSEQVTCSKAAKAIELLQDNNLNLDRLHRLLALINESPNCDSIKNLDIYKSLYAIHQSARGEPNCKPSEFAHVTKVIQSLKSDIGIKNLINYAKDQKLSLFIACDSKIDRDLEREVKQLYMRYFWNRQIGANIKRLADRIYPLTKASELDVTDQDFVKGFVAYYIAKRSAKSKSTSLESDMRSVFKDLNLECQRIQSTLTTSTQRLLQFDDRAQLKQMDDFVGGWILRSKVCHYIELNLKMLESSTITQIVAMLKKGEEPESEKPSKTKKRFCLF